VMVRHRHAGVGLHGHLEQVEAAAGLLLAVLERDCQEFRVRAMTTGRKEPSHGKTQSSGHLG